LLSGGRGRPVPTGRSRTLRVPYSFYTSHDSFSETILTYEMYLMI
jgi:hypothetical protein